MESCDRHDDCIVVYETRGYRTACPVCVMTNELDSLTGALVLAQDQLETEKDYTKELADELAAYHQVPSIHKTPEGRLFQV